MGFYDDNILPHMINLACGAKPIRYQRKKIVPLAEGRVLEVGMGSGLNLSFYDPDKVEFVWGLEPSRGMRKKAQTNLAAAPFEVKWLDLPGEEIPLDANTVDTVLLTYTLCTIPDWLTALGQMRRVLKPGGKLLFCEHGEAPDENVRRWQGRINGAWGMISGGCNLNRPIPKCIEEAGFKISDIEMMYVPSTPRIAAFTYWGSAMAG
jgi:SAM-dependent methyltransferase